MMRFLPRTIAIVTAVSPLFVSQMDAYCARCVKIEEERAKEQATHPQAFHYYDDLVSLHEEGNSEKDQSDSRQSDSSTPAGTEALSGSTTRITEIQKSSKSSDSSKADRLQSLLAAVNRPIEGNFFKESNTSDSTGKGTDVDKDKENKTLTDSESPPQATPTEASATKAYSAIYTVFKTKNFLETLDGNYTLFIPTNQAIQALSPEKIMSLARPENAEKLAALVSNHVIAKKILRKDFIDNNNQEIKAISGRNLTLSYKNGSLYVENIKISRTEPAGFDGVIYIIEKVIDQ